MNNGTGCQQRRVWMGLCRCFYEQGIYDKAIAAGDAVLEMNKHFPQAHKYIALNLPEPRSRELSCMRLLGMTII